MRFFPFPSCIMIAAVVGFIHLNANAQDAEQTLNLIEGWNAVHLRVTPNGTMASVFDGAPVELVTTWYPEKLKVSSLQDPAAEPRKNSGWRTWQASGLPGAFLNNLQAMESGRADLIKARVAATIRLRGTPSADRLHWEAQSFNFTGLPADPASPATFAAFFAGSAAHQPLRAFRMAAGNWQPVSANSTINPSEANWIWCGEGSEFQGPLDVRVGENPILNSSFESIPVKLLSNSGSPMALQVTATGSHPGHTWQWSGGVFRNRG